MKADIHPEYVVAHVRCSSHEHRRGPPGRRARRVRIRLVTYSTKPRGGVVHALHLAEALGDRGHHVELWALSADGAAFYREPRADVRLVPVDRRPGEDVELKKKLKIKKSLDYNYQNIRVPKYVKDKLSILLNASGYYQNKIKVTTDNLLYSLLTEK